MAVLVLPWFVPLNFAQPPGAVRTAFLGCACAAALLLALSALSSVAAARLLAVLVLATGGSTLAGGSTQAALLLAGEVAIGYVVVTRARRPLLVVAVLFVATAGSAVLDGVTHRHLYAVVFPHQYFDASSLEFRARGVIGQPVPAAMLSLALAAVLWVGCPATRSRSLARPAGAALLVGSLWATGSRSALVVGVVVAVVPSVVGLLRRPAGAVLLPLLPAVAVCLATAGGSLLRHSPATLRLLDFSDLPGSQSYVTRSQGYQVLAALPRTCQACFAFGHGNGALAQQLRGGFAVDGFTTLDNQFISWFWDYGVFGLGLLVACGLYGVYVMCRHSVPAQRRGFAAGIVVLVLAGNFYEATGLSTGAMLLGMCLAGVSRSWSPTCPA